MRKVLKEIRDLLRQILEELKNNTTYSASSIDGGGQAPPPKEGA